MSATGADVSSTGLAPGPPLGGGVESEGDGLEAATPRLGVEVVCQNRVPPIRTTTTAAVARTAPAGDGAWG
jgi:hypothetical protein